MPSRRHRNARAVEDLRLTIDCLPLATREAMLHGVRNAERVLVGAYTDGQGGVCPMLAAHRAGGRTDFLAFARSWDRFTRARRARVASEREVAILVGQLQASLAGETGLELSDAIAEHRALQEHTLHERNLKERTQRERLLAADPIGEIRARRLRPTASLTLARACRPAVRT